MKFKVGDKIKAFPSSNEMYTFTCEERGWIGKVTEVFEDGVIGVLTIEDNDHDRIYRGMKFRVDERYFEKVETQPELETKHSKPIVYKVYDYMKNFIGKANAQSAMFLANRFEISERQLREIIHEIRESKELELSIGSCKKGYYVCTKEDCEAAIKRLYRQAFSTLKVARALEKKVGMNGQGKIKIGEYFKEFYQSLGEEE